MRPIERADDCGECWALHHCRSLLVLLLHDARQRERSKSMSRSKWRYLAQHDLSNLEGSKGQEEEDREDLAQSQRSMAQHFLHCTGAEEQEVERNCLQQGAKAAQEGVVQGVKRRLHHCCNLKAQPVGHTEEETLSQRAGQEEFAPVEEEG